MGKVVCMGDFSFSAEPRYDHNHQVEGLIWSRFEKEYEKGCHKESFWLFNRYISGMNFLTCFRTLREE